jgi:hypothetical protein
VHEAERTTPSNSPVDAILIAVADSTNNRAPNIQQEASVIEKMTFELPTPREIEGVSLDEAAILALFGQ